MLIFKLGRRRRKKCDEIKPTCTGCTRNRLTCNWPPEKTETSRRRRVERRTTLSSVLKNGTSPDSKSSVQEGPQPFQRYLSGSPKSRLWGSFGPVAVISIHGNTQFSIINYSINYYLPIQVHHYPGREPMDQSYLVSMSLHFPPLMNALLACSALTLRSGTKDWQSFAIKNYIRALHEIRLRIADGSFTGAEDCFLATIMWLCIFEVVHIHMVFML